MKKQKPPISSAAAVIEDDDLLTEILLRIPPSPLLEFKLVSKKWHSLISDSQFCLNHSRFHHQNPNSPSLFLYDFWSPSSQLELHPHENVSSCELFAVPIPGHMQDDSSGLRVGQQCNGLLLLFSQSAYQSDTGALRNDSRYVFNGGDPDECGMYYVCNPTTKKCRILKFPAEIRYSIKDVKLAFDPLVSPDYKLVSVRRNCRSPRVYEYKIDLYSSETDTWSLLGIDLDLGTFPYLCAVYFNSAIHWPHLYFDVEKQLPRKMPELPSDQLNEDIQYFGESRGHLHLVIFHCLKPVSEFDVFELASDYSKWSVKYHVNLDSIKYALPELSWNACMIFYRHGFSIFRVVCGGEEEKDSMIVLHVNDVVLAHDIGNGTSRKLCDVQSLAEEEDDSYCNVWIDAYPCVKTLFCI